MKHVQCYDLICMTHHFVFQDLNPGDVFAPGVIFLAAVTYVGTAISVLCLVVTMITYTAFKYTDFQGTAL